MIGSLAIIGGMALAVSLTSNGNNNPNPGNMVKPSLNMQISQTYGRLPLYFIENQGQKDSRVKYYAQSSGQTMWFTKEGITFTLQKGKKAELSAPAPDKVAPGGFPTRHQEKVELPAVLQMIPVDMKKQADIIALEPQEAKVNYFIGNDQAKWRTNIPTYQAVVYKEAYPGIDLKFYGNGRQMEYDIIVKPGADPDQVKFHYAGVKSLVVTPQGDLALTLPDGEVLLQQKPVIYQEIAGTKVAREGKFKVFQNNVQFSYGFELAAYDKDFPLVIDPVLIYSTYLGGSGMDGGYSITVDLEGNAYVAGQTESYDFPTQIPYQGDFAGGKDVIICKFNGNGSLAYSTYLGGNGYDHHGYGIAVDKDKNIYVTGVTNSSNFPTKNPLQASFKGYYDAFATKLNADGSALIYSTYLGGSGLDEGQSIAVDDMGYAYIGGYTYSSDFPMANNLQSYSGGADAFVTKINPDGTSFVYSTYLGGSDDDIIRAIAVDKFYIVHAVGETTSANFPIKNPLQQYKSGGVDAFVTKINAAGNELVYSTYLGGNSFDMASAVALDVHGNAYVAGQTDSYNFPTRNPFQPSYGGGTDAWVAKINTVGSLVFSTYFGGEPYDNAIAIGVDSSGQVFIGGMTCGGLPLKNPLYPSYGGGWYDGYVAKLNASGSALIYSTYLGGDADDRVIALAVDQSGLLYATGFTSSGNFPTKNPIKSSVSGQDAFVIKISDALPNVPPMANAGPNQTVHVGTPVTLDGSGSSDQDGNYPLSYAWNFTATPEGSPPPELSQSNIVNPIFTPAMPGNYTLQLVVKDSLGATSAPSTVTISTTNTPPVADAGPDQVITLIGSTVYLNGKTPGRESYDPDGDSLTFQWTLAKPQGSQTTLINPNSQTPTFVADVHGIYEAQLVVSDPWGGVTPAKVAISFTNIKPVANAGSGQSVVVGETVNLNGGGSSDANGDSLTYQWSLAGKPQGSTAAIIDPTRMQTSFTPDKPGTYVAQLVVNDGFENSDASNIQIQVVSRQTAAIIKIQNLIALIADPMNIPNLAFKNANMRNTLINKLNAVIANLEAGNYADALGQLQHDILGKTDGCALAGAPDKNDWIKDCTAQGMVYPELLEIIAMVEGLM